jgi:hypothetical protein
MKSIPSICHLPVILYFVLILLDPVCFHQHLSKSLFNFHLRRVDNKAQEGKPWSTPTSIDALMNLAGSEVSICHLFLFCLAILALSLKLDCFLICA